ncbi:MAG TPA: class I SAM-dependent methyltransferase [Treponemataceae bacterium]|jgi:demethylmenaquinone methyltransferase/2-methoxy-6-polyprenyl-1,4-benzoquinol methylase|nr:MAG: Ubiquinone/menaquinone biosynthesis C-methyltransferase UbiE [Spirochaetes bacterium ADurb.Bin215]HPA11001.1 class I SAM-dependent methyltransferase [Treponemataceae bacterium]
MKLRDVMFSGKSERGNRFFTKMMAFLDSPKRLKYDDPVKLVAASGIREGQRVLEIGCGSGFFTEAASRAVGESGTLVAADLHPVAVETTRKKVIDSGLTNVTVVQDDAMNSSLPDGEFDLILLYGVVPSPVIDPDKLADQMHRILKPGGTCAIWTMVPFWKPLKYCRGGRFTLDGKKDGVFLLRREDR